MTKQILTYGTLPSTDQLLNAWELSNVGPTFSYELRGTDSNTAYELELPTEANLEFDAFYEMISVLVDAYENGNEQAGDIASSFLYVIGIEWM